MPNALLRNDARPALPRRARRPRGSATCRRATAWPSPTSTTTATRTCSASWAASIPATPSPNALFENPGHGNAFLVVELSGVQSNRSGYGARLRVAIETPQGSRELHRAVGSVSSFGGAPRRQELGLGDATRIAELRVTWPASGRVQTFTDVPLNARVRVTEDSDELERLPYSPLHFP